MPTETASPSVALTKPSSPGALDKLHAMVTDLTPTEREIAVRGASSIGGGLVGAFLWSGHRVLGFFAGAALAGTVAALAQGHGAKEAMHRLLPTATAVGGALLWRKHPILGFVGGGIAGGVVNETVVDRLVKKFGG